jgi:hypothetical protein
MNIEEFYSADERRRQSAEIEFGTNWFDASKSRYELSWVEDTGELYAMLERTANAGSWTPFGDLEISNVRINDVLVTVIGYLATQVEVEQVLAGWQAKMDKPDGISWVAAQLSAHGVPATAPV